jgi:hypothetical protein
MRQSGSEFGYLAPARDFSRTASIVLVAGAVGATAAAGAVFALLGGPTVDSSLATPAVTRPIESAVAHTAAPSQVKRTNPPPVTQIARVNAPSTLPERVPPPVGNNQPAVAATTELEATPAVPLTEAAAAPPERATGTHDAAAKSTGTAAANTNTPTAEGAQGEKKAIKKPAVFSRYAWRGGFFRDRWGGGFNRDRGWRRDVW